MNNEVAAQYEHYMRVETFAEALTMAIKFCVDDIWWGGRNIGDDRWMGGERAYLGWNM